MGDLNRFPGSGGEPKILESWKEISSYFDISVRTAQLWEKEQGLPVHRRGNKKARVFAYPAELEEWRLNAVPIKSENRPWVQYGIVIVLAVLAVVSVAWILRDGNQITKVAVQGGHFLALDAEGDVIFEKSFPDLKQKTYDNFSERQGTLPGAPYLIEDIDQDGWNEVFFAVYPDRDESEQPSEIVLFDKEEGLCWEKELDEKFFFNGKQYSGFNPFLTGFRNRVLISVAFHYRSFPALVSFWDSGDGQALNHYWHPGFLYDHHFFDADNDGREELLLSGINNPGEGRGHAALCALNLPPEKRDTDNMGIFNPMGSPESRYFLFPAPDSQRVQEAGTSAFIQESENGKLVVDVQTRGCAVFYTFSLQLALERVEFSDSCFETHTRLLHMDRIDHEWELEAASLSRVLEFNNAPNGNSPEVERLFQEAPNCSGTDEKPCLQTLL